MTLNAGQTHPKGRKDRILTQQALDRLLARLADDREEAARQYEQLRNSLITFFTFRGAIDPLEFADETITRVALRLEAGQEIRAQSPIVYFYAVARNIWRETLARGHRTVPLADPLPGDGRLVPSPHDLLAALEERLGTEARLARLDRCLEAFPAEDRDLLLAYYQGSGQTKIQTRRELALRLGITPGSLRNRVSRIRARLDRCLKQTALPQ